MVCCCISSFLFSLLYLLPPLCYAGHFHFLVFCWTSCLHILCRTSLLAFVVLYHLTPYCVLCQPASLCFAVQTDFFVLCCTISLPCVVLYQLLHYMCGVPIDYLVLWCTSLTQTVPRLGLTLLILQGRGARDACPQISFCSAVNATPIHSSEYI